MVSKSGFTLLEALLSALLFAVGVASLATTVSECISASSDAESVAAAAMIGSEKIEELKNASFSSVSSQARAAVSGMPAFERETVVTTPVSGLKQVAVSVYWTHKAAELSRIFTTYFSDVT